MEETTERVLREDRLGPLRRSITAREGLLYLEYRADTERAQIDLCFVLASEDPEDPAQTEGWTMSALARSSRDGLCALLRRTEEPEEEGKTLPDGSLFSVCGNCDSELRAEGGRLIYTFTPACAGCGGSARFDLGRAVPSRARRVLRTVENFDENRLQPLVWGVKHEYLENGGYLPWDPEEDGEE